MEWYSADGRPATRISPRQIAIVLRQDSAAVWLRRENNEWVYFLNLGVDHPADGRGQTRHEGVPQLRAIERRSHTEATGVPADGELPSVDGPFRDRGQEWWDTILAEIRACDVFVAAVSEASLASPGAGWSSRYAEAWSDRSSVLVGTATVRGRARGRPAPARRSIFVSPPPRPPFSRERAGPRLRPAPTATAPGPATDPTALLAGPREQVRDERLSFDQQAQVAERAARSRHEPRSPPLRHGDPRRTAPTGRHREAGSRRHRSGPRRERPSRPSIDLLRSISTQLDDGRCTPVLGFGLTDSLVGSRREIARRWSETFDYPKPADAVDDLPPVAQFVSVISGPQFLRASLVDYLVEQLREPTDERDSSLNTLLQRRWSAHAEENVREPHRVLARLNCPIYVNTHPSGLGAPEDLSRRCSWQSEGPVRYLSASS